MIKLVKKKLEITLVKKKRGFANLPIEELRKISAKGGAAGKPQNRAFYVNNELAREAGRKGRASKKKDDKS